MANEQELIHEKPDAFFIVFRAWLPCKESVLVFHLVFSLARYARFSELRFLARSGPDCYEQFTWHPIEHPGLVVVLLQASARDIL